MEIYKTFTFDSAHQLFLPYDSKCNELHGHTYKIEVWIKGTVNKETGLIADFTHIKKMINDNYDHKNLNQIPPFLNKNIPPVPKENRVFLGPRTLCVLWV